MKEFYRQETSGILAAQKFLSMMEITIAAEPTPPFNAKGLTVRAIVRRGQQQGVSAIGFVDNCG